MATKRIPAEVFGSMRRAEMALRNLNMALHGSEHDGARVYLVLAAEILHALTEGTSNESDLHAATPTMTSASCFSDLVAPALSACVLAGVNKMPGDAALLQDIADCTAALVTWYTLLKREHAAADLALQQFQTNYFAGRQDMSADFQPNDSAEGH